MFGFLKNLILTKNRYVSAQTETKIQNEWKKIADLQKQGSPSQLRQALISADRSLDTALRDVAEGETMGERLKNSRDRFTDTTYNKIWKAHKLRNNVVHEADFEPPHFAIKEAIEDLKTGIQSLSVKL
jgi:hypothetical protein